MFQKQPEQQASDSRGLNKAAVKSSLGSPGTETRKRITEWGCAISVLRVHSRASRGRGTPVPSSLTQGCLCSFCSQGSSTPGSHRAAQRLQLSPSPSPSLLVPCKGHRDYTVEETLEHLVMMSSRASWRKLCSDPIGAVRPCGSTM